VHKTSYGRFTKKERSLCTHYEFHGHTIDKCYKLHGYPPRYKSKQRNPSQIHPNQVNPIVSQVCETHQNLSSSNQVMGDFMQTLCHTQYQHLLSMLNTHLNVAKTWVEPDAPQDQASGIM